MIAIHRIAACVLGELDEKAEMEVEEHVLSCGPCAEIYASFARLGPAIVDLVKGGAAGMPITRSLKDRLEQSHLITRRYDLAPDETVACGVGAKDIYTLITFQADLRDTTRVDYVRESQRLEDVPFDAERGAVYMLVRADIIRTFPTAKFHFRLASVAADEERTLGEYTLDHQGFGG